MRTQIECRCAPGASLPQYVSHQRQQPHGAAIAAAGSAKEIAWRKQALARGESACKMTRGASVPRRARGKRRTGEKWEMGKRGRASRHALVSIHAVQCDSQAAAMQVCYCRCAHGGEICAVLLLCSVRARGSRIKKMNK